MGATILVVEDNRLNMKLVRDVLTFSGHAVLEAVTGEEGLSLAEAHRPSVVLMDIQLPGLDGYEITHRLKANPALRHIPIIAVTSYALSGDDVKAFEAGCDAYFAKPYDPMALLATIGEYVASDGR